MAKKKPQPKKSTAARLAKAAFTSAMVSLAGINIIDTERIDDPERHAATSIKQPGGQRFSKGMFGDKSQLVGTDGQPLNLDLQVSDSNPELVRVPFSVGASGRLPAEYRIDINDTGALQAMIQETEKFGADIMSRCNLGTNGKELPCKDQDGTNFCWSNAPVYCYEVVRLYANEDLIFFSPGSVAGPINRYTNQGGWGGEALKFMVANGVVPNDLYPPNQIRKMSADKMAAAEAVRGKFKVLEWWICEDLADVVSCLLRGWPVAVGLNWWSHEITYTNALWVDGELAIGFRNSWAMSYGNKGYSVLQGRKMHPDDAVTPRIANPQGSDYMAKGALAL